MPRIVFGYPPSGSLAAANPPGSGSFSITAQVERFDSGSGSYTITNGVAFRPGDITTAILAAKQLRVFVSGVEQAVYVEALNGRHPDNSIKVVLIQFLTSFTTPQAAEIRIGQVRQTTDIAKQAINESPNAFIFPTDPVYLCAANPLWHSITPMANRPTGSYWDEFEKRIRSQAPYASEGWKPIYDYAVLHPPVDQWIWPITYDPALRPHYEVHMMTGEGYWLYRGIKWAKEFLDHQANNNNWGIGEQYMIGMQDALMHYWLTGSSVSRDAPLTAYANDGRMINISAAQMADRTYVNNHGRMHYNKLMNLVIAHHLGLATVSWEPSAPTNAAKARLLVDSAIAQQFPDGHNTWPDENNGQQNWQVSMRSTALIAYHKWVSADSDIKPHILAGYNYINNNYWNNCASCGPNGEPELAWSLSDAQGGSPTIDATLNGWTLEVVAWLYKQDGGAAYISRGDEAIHGVTNQSSFWGQQAFVPAKQEAACLWGSLAYVAARQGA